MMLVVVSYDVNTQSEGGRDGCARWRSSAKAAASACSSPYSNASSTRCNGKSSNSGWNRP